MVQMTIAERKRILETISNLSVADPETADFAAFFVSDHHAYLRDPYHFLVLGGRGAGKTSVFRTMQTKDGFRRIFEKDRPLDAPDADNSTVLEGYSRSSQFPAPDLLDQYATDKQARAYWIGSLLIVLSTLPEDGLRFIEIMNAAFGASDAAVFLPLENLKFPSRWIHFVLENLERADIVLREFNQYLFEQERWAIIAYDDLDRLTSAYEDLFPFIRALLSFWHKHYRHWQRLRCKIFLRNDLYESRLLDFDLAHRMVGYVKYLEWNEADLYQLLIQKLAHSGSEAVLRYLSGIPGLMQGKDVLPGYSPAEKLPVLEAFASRLVGKYMGDSPRKGFTFDWIPSHLQDAKGRMYPRSFLKCFAVAAGMMLEHEDALASLTGSQLILPAMIRAAIPSVSEDRLAELLKEYPWLAQLKPAFRGLTMLMDKDSFIDNIDMDLWNDTQKPSLPDRTPRGIFNVLQQIGVVFAHENCVNVPELYLHAFQMQRKAGIHRIGCSSD